MAKKATSNLRSRTTRSSRGRLVTSTSENPNEQLTTQLSLLGLYAAQTIGDGNCLFRALADQVYGSAVLHGQVRQQICDWIEAHGERYEGFVEDEGGEESDGRRRGRGGKEKTKTKTKGGESEGGPSKRLQAYLRGMRENATYGGHMELSAFAHMTRRNIKVVQPGLVYVIEWRAGEGSSSSSSASTSANATTSSTTTSTAATSSTQHPPSTPSKPKSTSTAPPSTSAPASSSTQAQAPSSSSQLTSSTQLPSQTQPQPQPPATPERRRSTRTPSVGGLTPKKHLQAPVQQGKKPKKVVVDEGGEVQKVKTGRHGYYVYEEVTSDEEEGGEEKAKEEVGRTQTQAENQNQNQTQAEVQAEVKTEEGKEERMEEDVEEMEEKEVEELVVREEEEDGGPTIYVAYHDWEHFSSIRNLRGPHTGLPQIQETPAQTVDVPSTAEIEREAAKEREREKKRERERKEKERKERAQIKAKEKAAKATTKEGLLKVKLRLPTQTPTTSAPATPYATTPAPAATVTEGGRSASPFPPGPATPTKHVLAAPVSTASTSMSVSTPPHSSLSPPSSIASSAEREKEIPLRAHAARVQAQGGAGLGADRSAYRSPKRTFDESSASGGEEGVGGSGSGREEKRSRTRIAEIVGAETKRGPEDMDVDVDGDTPGLSAPGTSSSSESSEVTSEAEGSSPSASPEPPAPTPKKRFQHQHHVAAGEKQLTRRQRKALGLPKPRAGTVSAGKIVIPGGRWTGKALPQSVSIAGGGVPKGTEEEAEEEWRRNGTGRLDVRGFRELKI